MRFRNLYGVKQAQLSDTSFSLLRIDYLGSYLPRISFLLEEISILQFFNLLKVVGIF